MNTVATSTSSVTALSDLELMGRVGWILGGAIDQAIPNEDFSEIFIEISRRMLRQNLYEDAVTMLYVGSALFQDSPDEESTKSFIRAALEITDAIRRTGFLIEDAKIKETRTVEKRTAAQEITYAFKNLDKSTFTVDEGEAIAKAWTSYAMDLCHAGCMSVAAKMIDICDSEDLSDESPLRKAAQTMDGKLQFYNGMPPRVMASAVPI